MRKMLLALAALTVASSASLAADMPVKTRPAPPVVYTGADWTGFTVGVLGGGGWATAKPDFGPITGIDFDGKLKGWVAGLYVGYNWQVANSLVVGVEGDYTQADINNTQTIGGIPINTKLDRLATVRGRVGLLVTPNFLAYGTGGLALGSAEVSATIPSETPVNFAARGNHWGWTAGAGVEYSLGAKLKLRAEYLHYDLKEANYSAGILGGGASINAALTADVVRAGLGWQF